MAQWGWSATSPCEGKQGEGRCDATLEGTTAGAAAGAPAGARNWPLSGPTRLKSGASHGRGADRYSGFKRVPTCLVLSQLPSPAWSSSIRPQPSSVEPPLFFADVRAHTIAGGQDDPKAHGPCRISGSWPPLACQPSTLP